MASPDSVFDHVLPLLAEASERAVMPRFRQLREGDVIEKAKDEIVTVADREAEALIERGLLALWPGSRVVGEEACAANPALLQGLDRGVVWLVDPLDGTANFVAGRPVFAVMASLLVEGEAVGAWVLNPVSGERWRAQRGSGCFCDGQRMQVPAERVPLHEARGAVLTRFLPAGLRQQVEAKLGRVGEALPGARCAGVEYPAIITGRQQFAMFYRTLPWDHVPGTLLLQEAGGHVARYDGRAYRAADDGLGLLSAVSEPLWRAVWGALL
ncbi:inositol monophosphatase family protein [Piscinibacter sp. HJYY11]|uniref:inositol monophosphatase family protein n=1 Tax=Piscinibacter sp. HJYY11 TaxID=2801333 RepID=UPI0019203246|nr:inositol monophosphatase family protein [Piscinibacter sp. HJYY11]MBL0729515.1 inositol monophosphatase [Piscinibacter sp. HJYY11]